MLKEKNRLITEVKGLATVMNTIFVNITEGLDKMKNKDSSLNSINYQNIKCLRIQSFMTDKKFFEKIVTENMVRKKN